MRTPELQKLATDYGSRLGFSPVIVTKTQDVPLEEECTFDVRDDGGLDLRVNGLPDNELYIQGLFQYVLANARLNIDRITGVFQIEGEGLPVNIAGELLLAYDRWVSARKQVLTFGNEGREGLQAYHNDEIETLRRRIEVEYKDCYDERALLAVAEMYKHIMVEHVLEFRSGAFHEGLYRDLDPVAKAFQRIADGDLSINGSERKFPISLEDRLQLLFFVHHLTFNYACIPIGGSSPKTQLLPQRITDPFTPFNEQGVFPNPEVKVLAGLIEMELIGFYEANGEEIPEEDFVDEEFLADTDESCPS
jgi:hypothetical protein